MKKTILILSAVGFDNSPYCSYVHSHAKALAEEGYHVIVLAVTRWIPILSNMQKDRMKFCKKIEKFNETVTIDGVDVIYIKSLTFSNVLYNTQINLNGYFYYLAIRKKVREIMQKENVVLIDAHTFKVEGYVAGKLKKKYGTKAFVTIHGTSFLRNTTSENGIKTIKKITNELDLNVCVSNKLENYLKKLGIENTAVIYNGINDYHLKNVTQKKKFSIITVGNLIPGKRMDVSIKTIKKLVDKYPKVTLKIIGEGVEKEKLKHLAENLGIENNIEFLGRIPNQEVYRQMQESEIFILPSINEGFGIVYVEAMLNDCITIATKNEGIDGFIKNRENGFLVESNEDKLCDLIGDIYQNKYDLGAIRAKAKLDAQGLTWSKNAKEYIKRV